MIKNLFILLALGATLVATKAIDITLAWDASPTPAVSKYVIYMQNPAVSTNFIPAVTIMGGVTGIVKVANPGIYKFYVTATSPKGESDPSNILTVNAEKTVSPANLREVK